MFVQTIKLTICLCFIWLSFLLAVPLSFAQNQGVQSGRKVFDLPGYPVMFELDPGQSFDVTRRLSGKLLKRPVKLISVRLFTEPNLWFEGNIPEENYAYAQVVVEVDGKKATLLHRPYQMPVVLNGLRLYVETTREWAENAEIADLKDVQRKVRLSACGEKESWGPASFVFPIRNYRWRSAAYNNTWSSLVPYNKLYYHRGEDFGAIPDRLDVLSPVSGTIIASPLPGGDGKSNAVFVRNSDGITFRISHMNTETIKPEHVKGKEVTAGTVLAKTGMTWDGRKSQVNDPHCHVELMHGETKLASFPYLMEAYLRNYTDPVMAVAGGYQFTTVGKEVVLDGSRSFTKDAEPVQSYLWKLHDGREVKAVHAQVKYSQPGLYTEELMITDHNGATDRDFVQVRVYGPGNAKDIAYGWAYYYPVRDISVNEPVLFWNRLVNVTSPVMIDFGDGAAPEKIDKEIFHTFTRPGSYVVTLSAAGPLQEPTIVKLEVVIEP